MAAQGDVIGDNDEDLTWSCPPTQELPWLCWCGGGREEIEGFAQSNSIKRVFAETQTWNYGP